MTAPLGSGPGRDGCSVQIRLGARNSWLRIEQMPGHAAGTEPDRRPGILASDAVPAS